MRHRIKGKKLGRTASHRKATLQALAIALIKEKRIVTTLSKAKELRVFIEPLITRAKEDNNLNRQQVFSYLQHKEAVKELFSEVGPKSADRPGGYTRVIKAGFRKGDATEMAVIELVDYNDIQPEGAKTASKKRTRRAGKKAAPAAETEKQQVEEATTEASSAEEAIAEAESENADAEEVEAATESGDANEEASESEGASDEEQAEETK